LALVVLLTAVTEAVQLLLQSLQQVVAEVVILFNMIILDQRALVVLVVVAWAVIHPRLPLEQQEQQDKVTAVAVVLLGVQVDTQQEAVVEQVEQAVTQSQV
jgi:hypothetical protein